MRFAKLNHWVTEDKIPSNPDSLPRIQRYIQDNFISKREVHIIAKTRLSKYIEHFTTKKKKKKNENFQIKISDIFHISAQNIDCGYSLEPPRRGVSNEYPQSMFWAEIRKIMYIPVNPSFTM